jgi:hypothetical protein
LVCDETLIISKFKENLMTALHIAWFRFNDGVSPEQMEQHMAACRALAGQVPVVLNLQCGASYTSRAGKLTHCIVVTLSDRQALPAYLDHPAHVPVATALMADVAELQVMDLEV